MQKKETSNQSAMLVENRTTAANKIFFGQPGFLIRYGLTIIFIMVVMLLAATCFIKWPYFIPVHVKIALLTKPIPVFSLRDGQSGINFKDLDHVLAGKTLTYMATNVEGNNSRRIVRSVVVPVTGTIEVSGIVDSSAAQKENPQLLCYIIPDSSEYSAEIEISQELINKVRKGNKVFLNFDAYPKNGYGSVIGIVNDIYYTAGKNTYIGYVNLPQGLTTNLNEKIKYSPQLSVHAEVLESDFTLFEHLFTELVKTH